MPKTSSTRPVVLIQYRLVTDRHTDGQTHDDSKFRGSIASRGKKATLAFDEANRKQERREDASPLSVHLLAVSAARYLAPPDWRLLASCTSADYRRASAAVGR